ncbi:MAG TPA: UDP-glucose 4-epimerase GalE [Burkholderiales bacterium]|nr:UDP-glucose 4-epimerase GalE [Burkholderiales bacterium]
MKVLVVGGAGYIGSHMVQVLLDVGHEPVTLDSFVTGHRDAIPGGDLIEADLADRAALDRAFSSHKIDAVMHFASYIQVGESVQNPGKYYENNFSNTLNLLSAMVARGVDKFVFSSTAAIFGEPRYSPIDEAHPREPINPYGRSKLMVEQVLADFDKAHGLRSVCLRYFNAAGAHPSGHIGERHDPETHLIPLLLQTASGKRPHASIFGRDYDTPDGTCIRDYIHIMDLCEAHLLALDWLSTGGASTAFNLGNGKGFSVLEVIGCVERVTGKRLAILDAPRRAGDPARLVADASGIQHQLGWQPRYVDLDQIVAHAWAFERSRSV